MEYTPIEKRFPDWIGVRAAVTSRLPDRLIFIKISDNELGIDYSWMPALINQSDSLSDRSAMRDLCKEALSLLERYLPTESEFTGFLYQPLNDMTIHRISEHLYFLDRERQFQGSPSFIQMLKHLFGIELCMFGVTDEDN